MKHGEASQKEDPHLERSPVLKSTSLSRMVPGGGRYLNATLPGGSHESQTTIGIGVDPAVVVVTIG